jgi:hypothetical protein
LQVSKRIAVVGLNVSMSVFIGLSVYGFLKYAEGGLAAAQSTSSLATVVFSVLIVASIAGICLFGHQIDLRNLAIHREEEARKAADALKKGRRKPVKGE